MSVVETLEATLNLINDWADEGKAQNAAFNLLIRKQRSHFEY
jgi:hypothetical protein